MIVPLLNKKSVHVKYALLEYSRHNLFKDIYLRSSDAVRFYNLLEESEATAIKQMSSKGYIPIYSLYKPIEFNRRHNDHISGRIIKVRVLSFKDQQARYNRTTIMK